MITDLDEPPGRDPVRVGGKAAALAIARSAGASVLPGFAVEGSASCSHLRLGAETLIERGSGGARLAVAGAPLVFAEELVSAGAVLGDHLVARSSTILEGAGEWSGAFTSYVGIAPSELPKAVAGCWASAFSVAALERQEAAGIEPGSFPMSVLVQPAIEPAAGGWAQRDDDGTIVVYGIKGSAAPLLQGWEAGHEARHDGRWSGDELIELIGKSFLDDIRELLSTIHAVSGANRCEWALADRIWALQVGRVAVPDVSAPVWQPLADAGELLDSVKAIVLAPGFLGEEMVLPWAIGGISEDIEPEGPPVSVERLRLMCRELTEDVWGLPWAFASTAADRLMADLRGEDPTQVLNRLRGLRAPDPEKASRLLSSLLAVRLEMVERGVVAEEQAAWHLGLDSIESVLDGASVSAAPRFGIGRWEPLVASVVLSSVTPVRGTPASPGMGAGRRSEIDDSHRRHPGRRRVITSARPLPNLAALIWDAAGLVTTTGSPAAHLFEAARALRVPAVCGVDLGPPGHQVVAVDGTGGAVALLELGRSL